MKKSLQYPEKFFFIFILVFGSLITFLIPMGAGMDEEAHLSRIWEMSSGELLPNKYLEAGPNYPCVFISNSYITDPFYTPIDIQKWIHSFNDHIDWANFCDYRTRARYFPSLYILQAFIMGISGRIFNFPVPIIYYLIRLSYLFLYSLIIMFSVKTIPFGKWILGILSISPTALIQASIINPESLNNGISFLFIAWVIYIVSNDHEIKEKEWLITAFLVLLICTLKPNTMILLLLLLLIPKSKIINKKYFVIFSIIGIISILLISLGWNFLTSSNLLTTNIDDSLSVKSQIQRNLENPSLFLTSIAYTLEHHFLEYLQDSVGSTGYNYWRLPGILYWMYFLLIIFVFLIEGNNRLIKPKHRLFFLADNLAANLSIIAIFFILYNNPGSLEIPGIAGRYFVFSSPLLFIGFLPEKPLIKLSTLWIKTLSVITALVFTLVLFFSYHVYCGNAIFFSRSCYLPRYRNWSLETAKLYLIKTEDKIEQTFVSRCNQLSGVALFSKNLNSNTIPTLELFDNFGRVITVKYIGATEIATGETRIDYSLESVTPSLNKKYSITINSPSNAAWVLLYSPIDEYTDGELLINGNPVSGDVLFQYKCEISPRNFLSTK